MPYGKTGLWIEPWYKALPPFSWLFGGCEDARSEFADRMRTAGRLLRHPVNETRHQIYLAR